MEKMTVKATLSAHINAEVMQRVVDYCKDNKVTISSATETAWLHYLDEKGCYYTPKKRGNKRIWSKVGIE